MERVGIKEFKNRATQIVRDVRERSARYVVTVDGEPAAILKPYEAAEEATVTDDDLEEWLREWDELAEEIGKAWPKGLTGPDAVSEQRRQLCFPVQHDRRRQRVSSGAIPGDAFRAVARSWWADQMRRRTELHAPAILLPALSSAVRRADWQHAPRERSRQPAPAESAADAHHAIKGCAAV